MRINSRMESLWRESELLQSDELPIELQELLLAGWLVGPAGSLLLKGLYGSGWRADWSPERVAQHEYEINDVWVPSIGLPHERDRFLSAITARAQSFAFLAMKSAHKIEAANLLVAIISVGVDDDYLTHGATVKFFTRRGMYPQHFDDLERFNLEAMAVVDTSDMPRRIPHH